MYGYVVLYHLVCFIAGSMLVAVVSMLNWNGIRFMVIIPTGSIDCPGSQITRSMLMLIMAPAAVVMASMWMWVMWSPVQDSSLLLMLNRLTDRCFWTFSAVTSSTECLVAVHWTSCAIRTTALDLQW